MGGPWPVKGVRTENIKWKISRFYYPRSNRVNFRSLNFMKNLYNKFDSWCLQIIKYYSVKYLSIKLY